MLQDKLKKNVAPKDPVQTVERKEVLIVLPFLGYHSKLLTKQLRSSKVLYKLILWYFQRQNIDYFKVRAYGIYARVL